MGGLSMGREIAPFFGVTFENDIVRKKGHYKIIIYKGKKVNGLLSTSSNEIAVLDDDIKMILFDEHFVNKPLDDVLNEYNRIKALSPNEFIKFVNEHPRCRIEIG